MKINDLKVMIFADGASITTMKEQYKDRLIRGFTTNPTLMKKAGVADYGAFAREAVETIPDKPLSFEVFSDNFRDMEREALAIAALGPNVYVKIPITNIKGESAVPLIRTLSNKGVHLNVTAMLTVSQVKDAVDAIAPHGKAFMSLFAGRIADTGRDPKPMMREVVSLTRKKPGVKALWASCREMYNIFEAEECGADIITVTDSILSKINLVGMDLEALSLDTVRMFDRDGKSLGYSILKDLEGKHIHEQSAQEDLLAI